MINTSTSACRHCDIPLEGKFCHVCGQKEITHEDFKIKQLVRRSLEEVTEVDSKLYRTFRYLVTRPGFLTEEYFKGRRVAYFSPVKLYILCSLLYFFAYKFAPDFDFYSREGFYKSDFTGLVQPIAEKMIMEKNLDFEKVDDRFAGIVSFVTYLIVIFFAIAFKISFPKKYFAEHFVFTLHVMGFSFLVDTLLLPLYIKVSDVNIVIMISAAIAVVYVFFAARYYYRNSILKTIAILLVFVTVLWPISILLSGFCLMITIWSL